MQGWKRTTVVVVSGALVVTTGITWFVMDLNTAAQAASIIACVTGIAVMLFTLLQAPGPSPEATRRAVRTGEATVTDDGRANTGVASTTAGHAEDTGDAKGHGGKANTGVTDGL